MLGDHVKWRNDLVVSPLEGRQGATFVVKDPQSGRFFRLREVEYFVARQLDGSTPPEVICKRVEEKFGAALAPSTLAQFIENLGKLGFLEIEGGPAPAWRAKSRRSLLYLRLRLCDPDALLGRLVGPLRFFFTPHFLTLSAALILCALGIALSNGGEILRDVSRLFHFQGLALAWLVIFLVTTAHEFAHGLTCKHFGGEVHELGFMFLYFQPAFYCNVSDAWLFPEKSKRLWVTFAGAYFELFLWAVATLTWRVTEPTSSVNYVALVIAATSGMKTLLNLNPLLKLDGYYLLSDYLELPNLRQRAFAYLRGQIRGVWERLTWVSTPATSRDQAIYLAYGLLAAAYSFSLLGYLAVKFGGYLVGRYQGLGFILFAVLVAAAVRPSLAKPPRQPTPVRPEGQPGRLAAWRKQAEGVTLLGCVLALLLFGRMELTVSGPFQVLPAHNADVRAEVDGIIERILVDEGDFVEAGTLIVRLSDRDNRAELEKLQAETNAQRARLHMLKVGPRQEELELAATSVEKAEKRLYYARSHQARVKSLFDERLASAKEIEEAEEQVVVREKELEEAGGRFSVLRAGSRAEEIEATEAEIARRQAQRNYLEGQLRLLDVKSPIAGIVTTPRLREKIGQHVNKGDLIAEVHELGVVLAEIAVPEKEIADVSLGQPVVIKANAYPEQTFYGKVASIAPIAGPDQQGQAARTIRVTTTLDNTGLRLKPEMTGNAKIRCGERRMLALATRRLSRLIRVEFWSWW